MSKRLLVVSLALITLSACALPQKTPSHASQDLTACVFDGSDYTCTFQGERDRFRVEYRRAQQGDPVAMNNVGVALATGKGTYSDVSEAARWYWKSARQGNLAAQLNMAVAFYFYRGRDQNYEQAMYWFREAAAQHSGVGLAFLGTMYAKGEARPFDDLAGAYALYILASAYGNQKAEQLRGDAKKALSPLQLEAGDLLVRRLQDLDGKDFLAELDRYSRNPRAWRDELLGRS